MFKSFLQCDKTRCFAFSWEDLQDRSRRKLRLQDHDGVLNSSQMLNFTRIRLGNCGKHTGDALWDEISPVLYAIK